MDSHNRLFRTVAFGGFNKGDVIDYIERMKNEFFEYRTQVEDTIAQLRGRISQLEGGKSVPMQGAVSDEALKSVFDLPAQPSAIESTVDEINAATRQLRQTADTLCKSLAEFIDSMTESCVAVSIEPAAQPKAEAFAADDEPKAEPEILPAPEAEPESEKAESPAASGTIEDEGFEDILKRIIAEGEHEANGGQASDAAPSDADIPFDSLIAGAAKPASQPASQPEKKAEPGLLDSILFGSSFLS